MADEHRPAIPIALEEIVGGLSELAALFGDAAPTVLAAIQVHLTQAMAARDRGDPVATMQAIGAAMEKLASVADGLDPREAAVMRAVAEQFQGALLRGDMPEAKQDLEVMFERSGARVRKKPDGT